MKEYITIHAHNGSILNFHSRQQYALYKGIRKVMKSERMPFLKAWELAKDMQPSASLSIEQIQALATYVPNYNTSVKVTEVSEESIKAKRLAYILCRERNRPFLERLESEQKKSPYNGLRHSKFIAMLDSYTL